MDRRGVLAALLVALLGVAVGPLVGSSQVDAAPSGFRDDAVLTGLREPTSVEFSPDGRVFVAEKAGVIKVFEGLADPTPTVFADLRASVLNQWDRGLLDIALPPGFPADPWVYVTYTHDAEPGGTAPRWGSTTSVSDPCPSPPGFTADGCVATGRLSRLQAAGDVRTGAEHVLLEGWCQQYPSHTVGSLAFGSDGALYLSAGDGASFNFVDYGQKGDPRNPCGDPPAGVGGVQRTPSAEGGALRSQDLRTTGDPVGFSGSVLRLDPATGLHAPGNPLASSPDAGARRIIATGLRNPFRLTTRPGTDEVWLGDVGWNRFEEINRIADPLGAVENFGWPCHEGPERQPAYDAADLDVCEDLYDEGGVTAPHHAYGDTDHQGAPTCGEGRTVSGLAFYSGTSWPEAYRGALFFSDYTRDCIYVMPLDDAGVPDAEEVRAFTPASQPVQLQAGPGGDLYYVSIAGSVRRISYANRTPQAVIDATPSRGPAPLAVSFDGSSSSDADGGELEFAWDLDDDGAFDDGDAATATWTYEDEGDHTARLRVTDGAGASGTASTRVTVGGEPEAVITGPADGDGWAVGDAVSFSGGATDPQEGALPASALSWALVMHHCATATTCHEHGVGTFPGVAGGSFTVPDHEPVSYLVLTLTATDSTGLRDTASVRLDLKTVAVTVASNPSGVTIGVGPGSVVTPRTLTVSQGSRLTLAAPSSVTVGGRRYTFDRWSDGGAATHDVVAPGAPVTYLATYSSK